MALTDMTLAELEQYRPDVAEPADFDAFWADTLAESRTVVMDVKSEKVDSPLRLYDIFDVTFPGFAGDPIRAWLTLPKGADGPLPAVVQYIGYGGGRDLPGVERHWASAGYAHLLMDTRGQGAVWSPGDTPDRQGTSNSNTFLTNGLSDPADYYYRRVFTDGVRAVEAARSLPQVDPARVSIQGGSQGGAISLAVAGLVPDLAAVMPDVPFLCHFRRAVDIGTGEPYQSLTRYLSVQRNTWDRTFETLSYFDGVNFAKRAEAPSLFSIALMDQICPPSTCFAAYNVYKGPKELEVYPFNDHEGGAAAHRLAQTNWLNRLLDF